MASAQMDMDRDSSQQNFGFCGMCQPEHRFSSIKENNIKTWALRCHLFLISCGKKSHIAITTLENDKYNFTSNVHGSLQIVEAFKWALVIRLYILRARFSKDMCFITTD